MYNSYAYHIKNLRPEYKNVFDQICEYVRAENMDETRSEEILSEVMDSFLTAQEDGKSADQMIGGDLSLFCRELCSGVSLRSRVVKIIEMMFPVFVLTGFSTLLNFMYFLATLADGEKTDFWHFRDSINLWGYLIGIATVIVFEFITGAVLKKAMASSSEKFRKVSSAFKLIYAVLIMICAAYLVVNAKKNNFEGTYLWISLLVCTVYFVLYRSLTADKRKYKKENKISFDEISGAPDKSLNIEKIEMKLFEKLNKRNIRKGLPELTFSEFLEREEKACHSNTNGSAFHVLLAVFCTFLGFAAVILTSGFPHLSDGIFFVIITLTIEGLLMYALYKASCYNVSCKLKWIESKRNEAECEIQTEK